LLLDLQLPGMDGYEVPRRLRADARTSYVTAIAFIAASAHAR
jgi:CheY-like chemotaxis protein